jgi:hypothetical protein
LCRADTSVSPAATGTVGSSPPYGDGDRDVSRVSGAAPSHGAGPAAAAAFGIGGACGIDPDDTEHRRSPHG